MSLKEEAKEIFYRHLRGRGQKVTAQRDFILSSFLKNPNHVSTEELYAVVKKDDKSIGYATVARTVKILKEAGVAREVDFGSVVPVEVVVKNKNADLLFERLSLKKAPAGLGVRDIPVLLDANEEKSYFFLIKIPQEGDDEFLTVIEVKDRSGKKSASEIKFGKKFGRVSLEKAEFLIKKREFEKLNMEIMCKTRSS